MSLFLSFFNLRNILYFIHVVNEDAYISLTDIAKYKNPDNAFIIVANWMRNHSTISFLGLWEQIHNYNYLPQLASEKL